MTVDKVFEPAKIEAKWSQIWEQGGYYKAANNGNVPYCIMIPPPNVTGSLHMGHAFQDTIMDALIRYHRMCGDNTLWQVGTDHAGIATQMVVERQLQQQNSSRHDLGRDKFIEKVWEWKHESGNTITSQLRRLGASVDWSRERFTMDEGLSKAVIKAFVDLYREGLIYRGQRLVNWDPVLHTAISDLEVEAEEEQGSLWHIRYPLVDSQDFLVVATTRPETMLGDVAVAVHPEDKRYAKFIGKLIHLPLTGRQIPIIADEYVDPEFGTGCVKITPAHDFNDYDVGMRHKLSHINILTSDAKINQNAPEKYRGLDRFVARKQIIQDLTDQNLLEKTEPHVLKVPRGDRSNAVVEPFLTDQWFVKIESLAAPAIEAVRTRKIQFVPENWDKTYYEWMHNIKDWCISRQLWWGHRIPAWYDEAGNIYVGYDEQDVRKTYNLSAELPLKQDPDVLDTWFSSALWPFSTLGWPDKTPELDLFYPTNVLVTGFDIIFFWVARMIMFGLKFTGEVPFKEVYIHGLIQDQNGQKMSKTKGNVLDPLDLIDGIGIDELVAKRVKGLMQPQMAKKIEEDTRKQYPDGIEAYGTDALRFTYCAFATSGRFIRFDLKRLEGYRNFCNKIWNAARYVLMNIESLDPADNLQLITQYKDLNIVDKWILSRWDQTKANVIKHYATYRFDFVANYLYEFVWNEFCDWYLELAKPTLNDPAQSIATRRTLKFMLGEILQVLHPIMPFITEELWEKIPHAQASLLINHKFPAVNAVYDAEIEQTMSDLQQIILGVRNIRGEMNISPNKPLPVLIANATAKHQDLINEHAKLLKALAKLESITFLSSTDKQPAAATALAGDLQILIPMQGLIDKDAELQRLTKELEKLGKELKKVADKLANPSYVQKAPAEVVAKDKQQAADLEAASQKIKASLQKIESI
ncbi:MAG TPA: valine--tRNA ligase [Gammaproteobacteria bacterium]|nr:valine--tRNA ligase [Gammaproteobacteria bacterium]